MKPYVNLHPGPECGEEFRAWQGCPTIARTRGGRMFAGWYSGGAFEPCIDNYNILVMSEDDGATWSDPILTVETDRENRMRNIDIQLWVDERNRLWVMWTHSPYPEDAPLATIRTPFHCNYHAEFTGVEAMICNDPDAEELKWEDPRVICFGFLRCKPIIDRRGRYIFPAYDWVHPENYYLRISEDGGETFYDLPAAKKPDNRCFDETMIWEAGEELHLLARTRRGWFAHSCSSDGGLTWSETEPYEPAPSARMYIGRLRCGLLAYVRNIGTRFGSVETVPAEKLDAQSRTGMEIRLSDDDGKTWKHSLVLDIRNDVSYPDLCEDDSGNIYIIHDRERDNRHHLNEKTWTSEGAKEILLSKVTLEDIRTGILGEGSYTARVISKGGMNYVEK